MTVEQVREILAEHRDRLQAIGVVRLSVFGSVARGEARPDSDIDLLVELDADRRLDLLDFAHIKGELEDLLGRTVDLVEPSALRLCASERVLPVLAKEAEED